MAQAIIDIPSDGSLEASLSLLFDGYRFIQKRRARLDSAVFRTRLMLESAICMSGPAAARLFYDPARFSRKDALPLRIQKTLTGRNGIQTLDDAAHRHRKTLFMSFMSEESIAMLLTMLRQDFLTAAGIWRTKQRFRLLEEVQALLCHTACRWIGLPLSVSEARDRAADLAAMVDGFGAIGFRHWRGRRARARCEAWIAGLIERQRAGGETANSVFSRVCFYREPNGDRMSAALAAVELLNILRPIVAIATYIVFCVLALHNWPDWRERVSGDAQSLADFVQEVRRYYPFTPFLGARARQEFEWEGYVFRPGQLTLLDVYGMHHDPDIWRDPGRFAPDRFRDWTGDPFSFIPQGGGNHHEGHRCAGEWLTIEVMKLATWFFASQIHYSLPRQDLSVSLSRIPTHPRSGVLVEQVRIC